MRCSPTDVSDWRHRERLTPKTAIVLSAMLGSLRLKCTSPVSPYDTCFRAAVCLVKERVTPQDEPKAIPPAVSSLVTVAHKSHPKVSKVI